MYEVANSCVQRWFGELTGYQCCSECKGLIVDFGSSPASSDYRHSSSPPGTVNTPPSTTSESATREDSQETAETAAEQSGHATTTSTTGCSSSVLTLCCLPSVKRNIVSPSQGDRRPANKSRPGMPQSLNTFYPGFIREAPGPCNACRRVEGPHPTHCPGCTANYFRLMKENPRPPPGYIGKRPPFGQAGWRVARGHRQPKPVTLHGYGCYMQRRPSSYGGRNTKNFTHLGSPPGVLLGFKGCPKY